ncbi:MAG: peptidoglycan editing factor PgeF [Deltaproteobacteria bacterium]|nr:peptidoglycan editing factor PgeF [Deltaproteobacteria bacterium]MBN2846122.1 peptidoglycan editing factor PgeF [Deltaproteobacteria bacterium]
MPFETHNSFQFSGKGSIGYLESTALRECAFIVHAFLTRWRGRDDERSVSFNFGNPLDEREETSKRNWDLLSSAFDIPVKHFFTVDQVHGGEILIIDDDPDAVAGKGRNFPFDGIITARPGIAIGIKTADCVPVIFMDPVKRIVGAVHAGWKGTALSIAARAVDLLVTRFGSDSKDIHGVIGPAIGPCCYEVDTRVFESMKHLPGRDLFFKEGDDEGKWMLDLGAANKFQLEKQGIPAGNIYSADLCTSCHRDTFFSHRGDGGGTGRQLNFIMLR